ncbi:L,D-transpeptidase [Paenibacillus puldeungensis]|uniref:L,D-transpeptidase n=1 Tax=Paenibacillus puldeungensis TaxID=696536 RepID=A0ABW3RV56_9BACL
MKIKRYLQLSLLLMLILTETAAASPLPYPSHQALFQKFDQLNTEQVIRVTVDHMKDFQGKLSVFEKGDGGWTVILSNIPVVLGKNGIGKQKEGDGKTPLGTYTLGPAFGYGQEPPDLKVDYAPVTEQDYWIDDVNSADYNTWVNFSGNADEAWNSYEKLYTPLYKYAMVINYNVSPIIPGKGSAIFLHIWRSSAKPTNGCIALSEPNLLKVLSVVDPSKSPKVRISLSSSI